MVITRLHLVAFAIAILVAASTASIAHDFLGLSDGL
jgi:hypothetical protein